VNNAGDLFDERRITQLVNHKTCVFGPNVECLSITAKGGETKNQFTVWELDNLRVVSVVHGHDEVSIARNTFEKDLIRFSA
jgi:hypothetical protein